jgi:hypothetical protein
MKPIRGTLTLGLITALCACSAPPDPTSHGSAATMLRPATTALPEPTVRRTVYVPVYSNLYLGVDRRQNMVELSATVSVRNVSPRYPLVLTVVRYYDSAGKQVREYLKQPSELPPLASVEFVVQRDDTAGGPGANFLIQWTGPSDVDEPFIEAVMIGQAGVAGFSFTSAGRVLKSHSLD